MKEREDSSELYRSSYNPADNPYLRKDFQDTSYSFEPRHSQSARDLTLLNKAQYLKSKDQEYESVQRKYEEMYGTVRTSPFNPKNVEYKIKWDKERKERDQPKKH